LEYLQKKEQGNVCEAFNLGTGRGVTILEAVHSFEKVTGIKLNYEIGPRRKGDVIAIYANNDLAKAKLNWEPKFTLDDLMKTAWEWEQRLKADDTIFTGVPVELN